MSTQSYVEHGRAIPSKRTHGNGKDDNNGETLFGLVLALTTLYGLGSLIAFLVSYVVR